MLLVQTRLAPGQPQSPRVPRWEGTALGALPGFGRQCPHEEPVLGITWGERPRPPQPPPASHPGVELGGYGGTGGSGVKAGARGRGRRAQASAAASEMLRHRQGLRRHQGTVRPLPFVLSVDADPDVPADESHPPRCRSAQLLPRQPGQTPGGPRGSAVPGEAPLPRPPFVYGR